MLVNPLVSSSSFRRTFSKKLGSAERVLEALHTGDPCRLVGFGKRSLLSGPYDKQGYSAVIGNQIGCLERIFIELRGALAVVDLTLDSICE